MGGVEGWEVGTFYGHKVYKVKFINKSTKKWTGIFCLQTLKENELPMVTFDEFYIHTNRAQINKAQSQVGWLKFD